VVDGGGFMGFNGEMFSRLDTALRGGEPDGVALGDEAESSQRLEEQRWHSAQWLQPAVAVASFRNDRSRTTLDGTGGPNCWAKKAGGGWVGSVQEKMLGYQG
jgi:hypothetical protein